MQYMIREERWKFLMKNFQKKHIDLKWKFAEGMISEISEGER